MHLILVSLLLSNQVVAAARPAPFLRVTAETLKQLRDCEAMGRAKAAKGQLQTHQQIQKQERDRQAAIDVVKACRFASAEQYGALALRVSVAQAEIQEQRTASESAQMAEVRAKNEAAWAADLKQGRITQEELVQRREMNSRVEAVGAKAVARQKRIASQPPKNLDLGALMSGEEQAAMEGMLDAEVKSGGMTPAQRDAQIDEFKRGMKMTVESASAQPPLSASELAVVGR